MSEFIQITVTVMQIMIAVMLVPFLVIQYRVRGRGTKVIRRLRKHTAWQTTSILVSFITAAFYSRDGFAETVTGQLIALAVTIFLFVTFWMGTVLFWDIYRGKYDDEIQ